MTTTRPTAGIAALALATAVTMLLVEWHGRIEAKRENQTLREQIAQLNAEKEDLARRPGRIFAVPKASLAAPPLATSTNNPVSEPAPKRDLYAFMTNKHAVVKLTAAQVEVYLTENGRNAASLLSAFRTADNPALLQEALQKYPDDPLVNFEAAVSKDASPADRRQSLDGFKKSAPENSLGYYLSAADHFKAGEVNEAVADLTTASSKKEFNDYSLERNQADQEAYRAAGYPVAEANLLATKQLVYPQLPTVRDLSGNLLDLAKSYQAAGDATSGQAALEMAAGLGRRYSEPTAGEMLVTRLLGISLERTALRAMDPNSIYAGTGQSVQERSDELAQQRAAIRELGQQADPFWKTLSDQDWLNYQTRSASLGEEAAMRWMVGKFASK